MTIDKTLTRPTYKYKEDKQQYNSLYRFLIYFLVIIIFAANIFFSFAKIVIEWALKQL